MPDALAAVLRRVRRRRRVRLAADALAIGALVLSLAWLVSSSLATLVVAALAAAIVLARGWRMPAPAVARLIEARQPQDNLIVTAAELAAAPRPLQAEIRDALARQVEERVPVIDAARVVPLASSLLVSLAVVTGAAMLALTGAQSVVFPGQRTPFAEAPPSAGAVALTVRITPPAYTRLPAEDHVDPLQVTALAGSRIRIDANGRTLRDWEATESASLDLGAESGGPARFLSVVVVPDQPPSVRIQEPGRDTTLAAPRGHLSIRVDGRDDFGLASLALRYVKASGGGENVDFTEGEIPLAIERGSDRSWTARAEWPLDGLGLADGDVLVYRAIARDRNPQGAPVESDSFLVEIGRAAEIAAAGFALPAEEKKYAISQQMVIYKTEQLLANKAKHVDDWLEQSRMLGVEQRMVRAEVVFLSGGMVEDEVEEAAHSHELAEGRHVNPGQAEMVRALNFMSRAEAQLNDGQAAEALVFERQALTALERALDRRRYFLRTLPERSRIDPTRRLTGARDEARPWARPRAMGEEAEGLEAQRDVMRDLSAALADPGRVDAALAARVGAIDPASADMQAAAVRLAAAATPEERREAARLAMQAVSAQALSRLPGAVPIGVPR